MSHWRPRRAVRPSGAFDPDDWDVDDDVDDAEGVAVALTAPHHGRSSGLTWKDHFDIVETSMRDTRASTPAWSSRQDPVYVIDAARSSKGYGLVIEITARERDGDARLRPVKLRAADIALLPDPVDRQAMTLLAAAPPDSFSGYVSHSPWDQRERSIPRFVRVAMIETVLVPLLCATGRCFVRADDQTLSPLAWDDTEPWAFVTEVRPDPARKAWTVTGVFRRDGRSDGAPILVTATGLLVWTDRASRLAEPRMLPWISHLAYHGPIRVPSDRGRALLRKLLAMPVPVALDLPAELQYDEVRVPLRRRLSVRRAPKEWGATHVRGELSFDYDGRIVAASTPGRGVLEDEPFQLVVRDAEGEREAAGALAALGFKPRSYYTQTYELKPGLALPASKLPRIVAALLGRGWQVEAEGKLYRQPGAIRIEVTSGVDWFDLRGTVEFGDTRLALPALLAAARRGESSVLLGDGSYGMLPEDWLKRHGLVANLAAVHGDDLRFGRRQVGVLDALLSALPEATCDAVLTRARDALRRFDGVHPADPSPDFVGHLREYQREGLGWLHFLRSFGFGGCLADDMGLGKTVQVLALLDARREERAREVAGGRSPSIPPTSLVVMPRSLVFNWKEEATRFTPKLRVLDHTGSDRFRTTDRLEDYDVVLTTYGTLRRDATRLRDVRFDYVVLDEAQAIKNAQTDGAKAARLLLGDHRLALSGTPVQNHLGELWSLFEFLNPGMLGSATAFGLTNGARQIDDDTRGLLGRALRPFVLRRTKEQVAPELPARIEQTLTCELEGEQRTRYDELREHYRRALLGRVGPGGVGGAAIQVLEALLRLRQAACHLGLVDRARAGETSAKLDVLLSRLGEVAAEGHQALVFSQFTSFLAIVRARLDRAGIAYEYLDGRTRDRAARVERFQTDRTRSVFLISLTAGGLGLNLTAAEYVFLLDPWWNPAVEAQAIDRAHRIGQSRTVCAYRVIARDTVEDKILALQQTKRDLASALITGDNSLIRSLTADDLAHLLS